MSDETKTGWTEGYRGVWGTLRDYWSAYGGTSAFLRSPYLHLSLIVTVLGSNTWQNGEWWTNPLEILPSVLGFSLGGYAIWLAVGDERFRTAISGRDPVKVDGEWVSENSHSPFMELSATFAHFVVVQLAALVYAVIASDLAYVPEPGSFAHCIASLPGFRNAAYLAAGVGYWIFIYSLFTALAAGFAIFKITDWFDGHRSSQRRTEAVKKDAMQKGELDLKADR